MNILVIAPHPDDETLGCGGTLCQHVKAGARVSAVFLTSGELGLKHLPREKAWSIRESEAGKAAKVLGLAELFFLRQPDWMLNEQRSATAACLLPVLKKNRPGLIYLPHPQDAHPDHQASWPILRRALRQLGKRPPQLRAYEVWAPLGQFDIVSNITREMPRKLKALRAHASQLKEFDYVRALTGLSQYRGALAGRCAYAEVFASLQYTTAR